MKKIICEGCGAPLEEGMKICPRCGRVQNTDSSSKSSERTPRGAAKTAVREKKRKRKFTPPQTEEENERMGLRERIKARLAKFKTVMKLIAAAAVVVAVYIAVFAVQVLRVKLSSYDFKSDMTLSSKNYGQAIESYFSDGSWSVNPFTATCTYTGQTKHDEEYKIVFKAALKVKVEKIYVDGEKIEEKQLETRMMGMFI